MTTEPDSDEVAAAIRVSVGLLVRRMRQMQPEGELTISETSTLSLLDRHGPATSSDLARLDRISPQSMGAMLAALEQRNLVQRHKHPDDGRRIVLSLTDEGRQLVHARRGARTERIAAALRNGFTPDELSQLNEAAALLERLAEKL